MFFPSLSPGVAGDLLQKKHAYLYELMNELGAAIARRREAHEVGQDGHVESELLTGALREIIETCLAVDVVMAVGRVQPDASGALTPPALERLLPSSAGLWNDVIVAMNRFDENRAAGYDARPSAD